MATIGGFLPLLPPIAALVLFAVWGLLLVISIGVWRVGQTITGKANNFPAGVPHGSDGYWRLNRAHLNTIENLPVFGVLVLSALYLQVSNPYIYALPSFILYARFIQSLIHIASGSRLAILFRFTAYLVQVLCMLAMAAMILTSLDLQLPN